MHYTISAVYLRQEGGDTVEFLVSFIISVLASVVAYYICKWLEGDN